MAPGSQAPGGAFPDFEIPVTRKAEELLADAKCFMAFPADYLPEIIKRLPPPLPDAPARQLIVSAWPLSGQCRVTLAVRRNALPDVHTWYWAIESLDRIDASSP